MQKIELNWKQEMAFEAEVNGHLVTLDADGAVGGTNLGPRPKPLMLLALAGCTAMDVVSILKKMKVEPERFSVGVEGTLTDEHPKVYSAFHIIYTFKGDIDREKVDKAIALSQEKYCGVSAMYRQFATITHEVVINP
jgi:putative redox protein